jgi:hypothetical protein
VDLSKNRTAWAVSIVTAGIVMTATLAMTVWPALVRPEPPLEKAGDNGLRIRVVEPPKAAATPSSLLDVGLSQAAQAMAKGRGALFVQAPPVRAVPPPAQPRPSLIQVAQADSEDDLAPPPQPVDDRWEDEAARRQDRFEHAQRQRWEDDRLARQEREQRAAWEQDRRDRWENAREQDRYEEHYDPPPRPDEERAPPGRW